MSQRACCSSLRSAASIGTPSSSCAITRSRFLRGLGDLLAGLARVELRARQLVAARALGFGAQLLEPVAQPRRGHAVVAVVALDDGDVLGELARRRICIEAELELRLGRSRLRGAASTKT